MRQETTYQRRVATQHRAQSTPATRTPVATTIDKKTATRAATQRRRRTGGKMMLFGAMSIASYVFLFANEHLVTQTYTLGGWHAAFPVATAFFFSFIHGAFASNLLSFFGMEAKKA